jgi:BlaI family penicillinase repressor
MGNKYQISDAEWIIMKVIWAQGPLTASEIIDKIAATNDWAPKTIKTLLNRLVSKSVLGFTKEGRSYRYHAEVSAEETIQEENKSFLDKIYGGNFSNMLASFVEQNDFSDEDLEMFKQILEGKKS